jgi:hypothetical protein
MGRISKLNRKKGTVYRAEIRLKCHPHLCQTFDSLSKAQRWVENTETILRSWGVHW